MIGPEICHLDLAPFADEPKGEPGFSKALGEISLIPRDLFRRRRKKNRAPARTAATTRPGTTPAAIRPPLVEPEGGAISALDDGGREDSVAVGSTLDVEVDFDVAELNVVGGGIIIVVNTPADDVTSVEEEEGAEVTLAGSALHSPLLPHS